MTTETTPIKLVCRHCHLLSASPLCRYANDLTTQAAAGLDILRLDGSPAKKLSYPSVDKENAPFDAPIIAEVDFMKPVIDVVKTEPKAAVAPTIKDEEADEPLLQENAHRFVLFPIKYHEVRIVNNTRATREVNSKSYR